MFILLGIIFILIGVTAFYGDYEQKERDNDYKKYEEVLKNERRR